MVDSILFKSVFSRDDFHTVVVGKDVHDTPAVPVVSHSAAIVNVACRVLQNLSNDQVWSLIMRLGRIIAALVVYEY